MKISEGIAAERIEGENFWRKNHSNVEISPFFDIIRYIFITFTSLFQNPYFFTTFTASRYPAITSSFSSWIFRLLFAIAGGTWKPRNLGIRSSRSHFVAKCWPNRQFGHKSRNEIFRKLLRKRCKKSSKFVRSSTISIKIIRNIHCKNGQKTTKIVENLKILRNYENWREIQKWQFLILEGSQIW